MGKIDNFKKLQLTVIHYALANTTKTIESFVNITKVYLNIQNS